MEHDRSLLARPLVIPEIFDITSSWSDWSFHFENVAAVNGCAKATVVTNASDRARAESATPPHGASFRFVRGYAGCLMRTFRAESRYTSYQAEFQARRKRAGEGWADFADDLRDLADKAHPTLLEEARERLSINAYLAQLPQPQISFSVCQNQPMTPSRLRWRWNPTCHPR